MYKKGYVSALPDNSRVKFTADRLDDDLHCRCHCPGYIFVLGDGFLENLTHAPRRATLS